MSPPSDGETLDRLLVQICKLHYARAQALFESVGLYRGQPPVLRILEQEGGLSHSQLAARLDVTPATVSRMLDRMENAGFVRRQPDLEDQRISRVYLTEKAGAVQGEVRHLLNRIEEETFAGFASGELALLRHFLLRMRQNLLRAVGEELPLESGPEIAVGG